MKASRSARMLRMRRIVLTVAIAFALMMAGALPASAHTVAGTGATNYRTTLRSVAPSLPGLSVKIIENGSRLQASYTGEGEVVVLGYQGEPYLRISDKGVFENLRSPATYINRTRNGVVPPSSADPNATPKWQRVSTGHVARWHDHRIHWMGGIDPPVVRRAPEQRHVVVPDWSVTFTHAGQSTVASGDLVWVPGPSAVPWFLVAAGLAALVVVAAALRRPHRIVAVAVGALVLVDIAHSVGIGFANAGTSIQQLGRVVSGSTVSIPAWIVGAGAFWFLMRRRVDGFFAAVFCALIVALVGGLADVSVLGKSQVPFAWSGVVARALVAASLGLGVGVAVASGLAIRRLDPPTPEVSESPPTP